jgi:pimeloyl-ACP methyl ester carboxylesterase
MMVLRNRWNAVAILLGGLAVASPSSGQPTRSFGSDSTSTGVFTGAETTQAGLQCSAPSPFKKCSGFLASDDGTLLDVTVTVPPGEGPHPLVVYVHGYGGSKTSSSSYDDAFASRGLTVLRHSTRGFGQSWGQVNLSDVDVEVADMRSLIGQVVDDARLNTDANAVAIAGASYGGGHSWLAAVKPAFTSPGGKEVRIRTVVPIASWSDLLASLRPNGQPQDSVEPPGFYKLSFLEALFLGGIRRSPSRPYPNYPSFLWLWNGYALATEPNNLPPVGSRLVDGIAGYRSIWWQRKFWEAVEANKGTEEQLPILIVQGFTDDLFPLTEALRMHQALRTIDEGYPIAAYFGDIGHPRAANKPLEVEYVLERVFEWLDFYLLHKGTPATTCGAAAPQLRCDVLAAITRPGGTFNPATDVIQVNDYADLATAEATAELPGEAMLTFNPANVAGLFVDPFVFAGCDALTPNPACTAPIPASVPGDVAVYPVSASELSEAAGLAPGPFLIAGQPLVTLSAASAAPRVQLNARLYHVKPEPDGSRQLVTRGTVTLDSGAPLTPIGSAAVRLTTYGNLWEVDPEDVLQLELTNVDSPYLAPSRVPSVTVIRDVKLMVPVR